MADGGRHPHSCRRIQLAVDSETGRRVRASDPARRDPLGLGIGLAVAPLTAGVLAAVDDSDLGEASAINDAASRVGGVVMVALVPALLGAGITGGLGRPLANNYQSAMLVMAGLSVAAAIITALFVAHGRITTNRLAAATPRVSGCALPESVPA